MVNKPQTKKIKITSKGFVTTSRGRCRTPITNAYMENTDVILSMLTRDKAKVVEVLPTGGEVELTIYNFSQNNSAPAAKKEAPVAPAQHVADPRVVNAGTQPSAEPERQLTRKERRELERRARAEAAGQNAESVTQSTTETEVTETTEESVAEVTTEPEVVEGSSIIDSDIVEE